MRDPADLPAWQARLEAAAGGGRVASTPFLEEAASSRLRAALRAAGVAVQADGGYPGAARRVVTARPSHVPAATPALVAWTCEAPTDPEGLRAALEAAGVPADRLGDAVPHAQGASVIVRADGGAPPSGVAWAGDVWPLAEVDVDRVAVGTAKEARIVVPSLRADVVGATALGRSRSWFDKGVAAGRVRIDGVPAGKATSVAVGAELWAEALGRVVLLEDLGATRRGKRAVRVRTERPRG